MHLMCKKAFTFLTSCYNKPCHTVTHCSATHCLSILCDCMDKLNCTVKFWYQHLRVHSLAVSQCCWYMLLLESAQMPPFCNSAIFLFPANSNLYTALQYYCISVVLPHLHLLDVFNHCHPTSQPTAPSSSYSTAYVQVHRAQVDVRLMIASLSPVNFLVPVHFSHHHCFCLHANSCAQNLYCGPLPSR